MYFQIIVICIVLSRNLYRPTSSVYQTTVVGDNLAEMLTSTAWDLSQPSRRSKEVRPFDRHSGPRGYQGVRSLGRYKVDEARYQKL